MSEQHEGSTEKAAATPPNQPQGLVPSRDATTRPCEMWLDVEGRRVCGQPATLGIPAETSGLIPICDDCISWSGNQRKYLKSLGGA